MSSLIERAGAWFLHSGIQEPSGGVARYYRSDLQTNARISNEITGYAISACAWFHQRTGLPEYRQAALNAADFLLNSAWDKEHSIFPFEYPSNGLAYFFDCGIIARGLLAAFRLNEDSECLSAAAECGRAMLSNFRAGKLIHPRIELPSKRPLPPDARWSAMPGCYQLKAALAWHDLQFHQAYEESLAQALEDAETFLPGVGERDKVMDRLHAFCYFLEGLLPVIDRPECAAAYRSGLERVAHYLSAIEPDFVRSDVS